LDPESGVIRTDPSPGLLKETRTDSEPFLFVVTVSQYMQQDDFLQGEIVVHVEIFARFLDMGRIVLLEQSVSDRLLIKVELNMR
jgi:hypothetical protein